jgi:general nucleoside transport system permease protein
MSVRSLKRTAPIVLGSFALISLVVLCLIALGIPVLKGLQLMFEGSFKDKFAISSTLVRATPLLLAGTGVCIAWRAGAFNIGGEGQLLMGALGSAALGKLILNSGLGQVGTFLMLALSALTGGAWSALACWIAEKRGVDLVIATILMNFIADKVLFFFVDGPLRKAGQTTPLTDQLPDALMLWRPSRQMDLNLGTILAIVLAVAAGVWLYRTQSGYLTRVVGENARFARANRVDAGSIRLKAMALSGMFCGLAGGVQYLGINGQLTSSFSQQYGFLAIPVALVAGLNPVGAIFSSVFFGGLFAATSNLSRFGNIGNSFVYIIQAGAVLGLLAFREIRKRRRLKEVEA